ncbi:MAG: phosphatidate cytidylyltransferase [Candidatus Omnitrophota bacterium]|jgi:phosphatidate cytidylyltransferase
MLIKRIITACVVIPIVALAVLSQWFFNVVVMLFIISGLYEFFTMLENKGITAYKYFGILMGTLIPVSIMFSFEPTKKWELFFIVLTLLFLITMLFKRRENYGVIVDISTTIFGILYVSWFFSFLIKIRSFSGGTGLLAAVLLITKLGDIGAYLVGSRFGKTPLIPRISPNKSLEGSLGGLFFSVAGALISRPFFPLFGAEVLTYTHLILMGITLGIIGQLGDLAESLMKRDCGVKDSGVILPGMGGVLDVMDSLLFTAPVFYFYISIVL